MLKGQWRTGGRLREEESEELSRLLMEIEKITKMMANSGNGQNPPWPMARKGQAADGRAEPRHILSWSFRISSSNY